MRKLLLIGIVLLGACAAAIAMRSGRSFAPASVPQAKSSLKMSVTEGTSQERKLLTQGKTPTPQRPKEISPIRISFETPNPPRLNQSAEVILRIDSNPGVPFSSPEPLDRLEILIRLPAGIKLVNEGWRPVQPPPEEETDPSGPWSLFERSEPFLKVLPPSGEKPESLTRVPISLTVTEEGINWVITARARIIQQGELAGQAFGILFATLEGEVAEFHTTPKATLSPPS